MNCLESLCCKDTSLTELFWPLNPAGGITAFYYVAHLQHWAQEGICSLLRGTGHYCNLTKDFSHWATEHVTVPNIYCHKLPRSNVYGAQLPRKVCECVCVSVCVWIIWKVGLARCHAAGSHHRTNYFLSFALLCSASFSFFLALLSSWSLPSAPIFSVCLILILLHSLNSHPPCPDRFNLSSTTRAYFHSCFCFSFNPFLHEDYFTFLTVSLNALSLGVILLLKRKMFVSRMLCQHGRQIYSNMSELQLMPWRRASRV